MALDWAVSSSIHVRGVPGRTPPSPHSREGRHFQVKTPPGCSSKNTSKRCLSPVIAQWAWRIALSKSIDPAARSIRQGFGQWADKWGERTRQNAACLETKQPWQSLRVPFLLAGKRRLIGSSAAMEIVLTIKSNFPVELRVYIASLALARPSVILKLGGFVCYAKTATDGDWRRITSPTAVAPVGRPSAPFNNASPGSSWPWRVRLSCRAPGSTELLFVALMLF